MLAWLSVVRALCWSDYSRLDFCRPGDPRVALPMLKIPWPPMTNARALFAASIRPGLTPPHAALCPSTASESSESGEETSDEEGEVAFPHGPVYVMSPPATDVQSSPVSSRRSAKRRRSGAAALTPRSKSKRAALELDL